jgi:hypothetical protein
VILVAGLGVSVCLIAPGSVTRRIAVPLAAAAVLIALSGPAAYTLDTVLTSHTGAIPSAGPSAAVAAFGPGGNRAGFGRQPGGGFFAPPPGGFIGGAPRGGGGGGFLQACVVSAEMAGLLEANPSSYRWVAATIDANSAAGYELATGEAVMAIGGFNGSDPAPTLAQFQAYVSAGQIHYFIAGGMRGGGSSAGEISTWVSQNFTATAVGGATVYDLTQPAS